LYSVDTDEQGGQGSVNALYDWFVYLPDGVTEVPQAVITTQQGAEGSTNQIQVDWSNVLPGDYVVTVIETDTLTTCVGQPVSINVTVLEAIQPDVSCTSTTIDEVDFTWNSITGATSYTIEEFVNGVTTNQVADYVATDYSVVGLSAGDSVTLVVTPIGSAEACFLPDTASCSTIPCDINAIQSITTETTCGLDNGALQVVNVIGGTAPFTYSIDGVNYDVVSSFANLAAGDVEVFVIDANGCLFSQTFTIDAIPNSLVGSAGLLTPLTCQDTVVFIAVTASGGQGPYTGAGLQEVTEPGDYFYVVTDAEGCTDTTNIVTVDPPAEGPSVTAEANGSLTCLITSVPVTVTVIGGTPPYSGDVGPFNEGAGTFTYTVTDANGCESVSDPITILPALEGPTATIDTLSGGTVGCGQEQVVLTVSASGGLEPYTNTGTYNVGPGFYTYTVTDDNDCPSTVSITIGGNTTPPTAAIVESGLNLSCTDSVITLTSQFPAAEYQWLQNNNVIGTGSSIEVTQGGDYTLIVTAANNCSAQDVVTITQDADVPSFDLITTANELNCDVTAITIIAQNVTPAGGTFTWSNGAVNVNEITVSTANTYEAIYVAPNGCEVSQSVVITQDTSSVVVTITPTATELTCDIDQITLTATGADTYEWSTGEAGSSIVVSAPNTYTVIGSTVNGCSDQDQVIITLNTEAPTPAINASDVTLTCDVPSITLTASGGVAYDWGFGPSANAELVVTAAGYYTVEVFGDNGCSDTLGVAIDQQADTPDVQIVASANPLTCENDTIILTASGAVTYTWNGGLETGATLVVTGPGIYTVEGIDEFGCPGTGIIEVQQNTISPIVEIINLSQNDILTCDSTSVQVQAQGADSYAWSGGLGVNAFALITQAGTYQVTGTDAINGCSSTAEITIGSDGNLPVVTINNLTGTFELGCDTTQIDVEVVTNVVNGVFVWDNGLPSSSSQSLLDDGIYTVTVTDPLTGCQGQSSITITEDLSLPVIEIFNTTGVDTITCNLVPQEIALFATGGVQYEWQDGFGTIVSNSASLTATLPGDYQVTVIGENGCSDFILYSIYENLAVPDVQITALFDTITCARTSIVLTASGASTYSWSTGAAGPSITVVADGDYSVDGIGSNGCVNTATYTIEIDTISPGATINASLLVLTCQDSVATLSGAGNGAFVWNNGLSSDASIDVQDPGLYVLEVTASNGCISTDQIEVDEDVAAPVALITPGGGVLTCQVDSILLTASGGVSYAWFDGSFNEQIYADAPGTYSVVVTAANGCTDEASVTITQSADLPIVSIAPLADTLNCNVPTTQLTASVLNGSVNYTWTDANNAVVGSTASLLVNQAGVYTATALDANGCEGSAFVEVVGDFAVPIAEVNSVTGPTELTCTILSITLEATGGESYQWNYNLGTDPVVNVTAPQNNYTVVVTGLNGCDTTLTYAITQNIALPAVAINNLSGTNELTCLLDTIDVQAVGGFVYEWNNGLGFGPVQIIDAPGTYQVTATGENGCRDSVDIVINQNIAQPAFNVVNLDASSVLTCALDTINITALGSATFVWTDATGNTLSNVGALGISEPGDYTLTATGDNGCISDSVFSFTQDITQPLVSIDNVTAAFEITCSTDSIQLNVTTDAVTFDWTPAIYGSASTIFVTQQGDYTVNAVGANGCEANASISITEDTVLPGAIIASSLATNTLTCSDNVITLIPDGAGTYSWSGGGLVQGDSLFVSNPGNYTLTVTGLNGCISQNSIVINQDVLLPTASVVNLPNTTIITCSTEEILLTASGGVSYTWLDEFDNALSATNAYTVDVAGAFTAVVTAANGCSDSLDIVISENIVTPTVSISNTSGSQVLTCTLQTIELTATGATEFTWTNSSGAVVSSIADLNVITPDTYTITGIAANGCQDTAQIVIGLDIADPLVSISNLVGSTTLTCSLDSIVLLAQGNGVSYSWSDGATVLSNSALLQVEIAGVYEVTAIGSNGCDSTQTITILSDGSTPLAEIDLPLLNDTLTCDITSIELLATGGTSYAWANGLGNSANVSVTEPGLYVVTVTSDATGCSADATIEIFGNTTPPSVAIENTTQEDTITCATPSITLQASGAANYNWAFNGSGSSTVSVTGDGIYSVTGTGINGCTAIANYQIFEDLIVPLVTISNPSGNLQLTCDSTDIDVVAQGATTYVWEEATSGVVGNAAGYTITNLGVYTVTGSLANGCSSQAIISVTENIGLPTASIQNNTGNQTELTCQLDTISLTATGGQLYSWSNGAAVVSSEADFIAGTPGFYIVTVTGANGCIDTASVSITSDGSAPIAGITIPSGVDTLTCGTTSTTLVASGGGSYAWSNGGNQSSLVVDEPGEYTVTVTAANGCSASTSVEIFADTIAPVVSIDNGIGTQELTCDVDSIAVSASGGIAYQWSNGASVVSNVATLDIIAPALYTVTVTGTNGCANTASINITENILDPVVGIDNPEEGSVLTCAVESIALSAFGADEYVWTDAALNVLGNLDSLVVFAPGVYSVTGTNANGCIAVASLEITQNILLPTAVITNNNAPATTLTCTLDQIDLTASGGVSYSWSNGSSIVSNSAQLSVNAPDTYVVTVTGSNGCIDTASIVIGTDGSTPVLELISSANTLTCDVPSITLNAIGLGELVWSVVAPAGSDCQVAGDPSIICPAIFDPVCGCNGTTYPSACEAEVDGVYYYVPGECGTPGASAVTISTPGTYTVTLTASNGCTTSQTVVISEDVAPPALTITSDSPSNELTCADALIQLTANTTGSINWSNSLGVNATVSVSNPDEYTVTATGTNGCVAADSITIVQDIEAPALVLDTLNNTATLTCVVSSIELSASGAANYTWTNSLNQVVSSITTLSVSAPGTFTLTAEGANGCDASVVVNVGQDVTAPLVTISSDDSDNQLTCADPEIILSVSGTADSYVWSSGSSETEITVGSQNEYVVVGTDTINGCTTTQTIQITSDGQLPLVAILADTTVLNCSLTEIVLTADTTANTFPVTLSWSNGLGSNAVVSVDQADAYTVTATAANGCSASASVTITEDLATANAVIVNNTGTTQLSSTVSVINVTATGGVSYVWSAGLGTNPTVDITSDGEYTVIVTGENGCQGFANITITDVQCIPPTVVINNASAIDTLTCSVTSIEVVAEGANIYSWSNGLGNSSTASITAPGTYIVTGTNLDGCSSTDTITIGQNIVSPVASITNNSATTLLTCAQNAISLTASGGVSYSWDNGLGATATVSVGAPELYTVTVTAANGCSDTASVNITTDGSTPSVAITNNTGTAELTCTTTSISVTASGGVSYSWSGGLGNTANASITTPGTYTVTATAGNGCIGTAVITVTQNNTITAGITNNTGTTVLSCALTSIGVTATGGVSYSWSNGLGNAADATITAAGTYVVTVTGANGCVDTESIAVTNDGSAPQIGITNNTAATTLTCAVQQINLTATGGSAYSWSNGLGNQASAVVTVPGTYTVTSTGTNGCVGSSSITITQDTISPVAEILNNSGTTILSCLLNSISVTATGGGTYSWSNGLGNTANATITASGNYTVTVTATNGCTDTASIAVTDDGSLPQPGIISSVSSNTLDCVNTSITLTGIGSGSYSWSNGVTNLGSGASIVVSDAGTYTLMVTASNGCSASTSIAIEENIVVNAAIATDSPFIDCNNSDMVLTASGGVSYLWTNGNTSDTLTVYAAGSYSVTVTASNGCSEIETITVAASLGAPTVSIDNNTGTTILGCNTNSISLTANGGVSYVWSNNLGNTADVTVLNPGLYTVTATGANGCVGTASINITQDNTLPVAGISAAGNATVITCLQPSIVLAASGNGSYQWDNGLDTPTITVTEGGIYSLTVTGSNGCTNTTSITITENNTAPVAGIINTTGNTVLSCGISFIAVTATGGGTYSWSGGLGSSANATITQPGTYVVTVTSSNGCSDSETIVITDDGTLPEISINASADALDCFTTAVDLNVTGASGTITWSVAGPNGAPCPTLPNEDLICSDFFDPVCGCNDSTYSNPCYAERDGVLYYLPGECGSTNGATSITVSSPGVYTVTLIDANGCEATDSYTIEENLEVPVATVASDSPICSNEDAEFTISGTAGDVVTYTLNGGAQQTITIEPNGSAAVIVEDPTGNQQIQLVSVSRGVCFNALDVASTVVVNETPQAVATGPAFGLCEGSVLSLNAAPFEGATFNWTGPGGFTSSVAQVLIPAVDLTDAGDYILSASIGNCVDTDTITVVVVTATSATQSVQICVGQTYTLPDGDVVSADGTYTSVIDNSNACDSTVTTILEVVTSFNVNLSSTICEGDSLLMPDGTYESSAGTFEFEYISSGGCDSIVTIELTVNPTYYATQTVSICEGEDYTLPNGQVVTLDGVYEVAYTTINGCDSIWAYDVNVLPVPETVNIALTLCPGETQTLVDGQVVSANGEYTVELVAANSCDSIVVYTATYYQDYRDTVEVTICNGEIYELPNGQLADATNEYLIYEEQSVYGCDSSQVYVVTELPALSSTQAVNLCYNEVFTTPNGTVVGTDGDFEVMLSSAAGCDSLVIYQIEVGEQIVGEPQQRIVCFGETENLPDGTEVSVSGEYVSILEAVNGCDSLIITNVVAFPFLFTEYSDFACEGEPYVLPDGSAATTEGIYPVQLTSQFGCDSIVQVTVDFTPMVMVSIIPEADSLELCQGDTALLIADGAMTYTWESSDGVLLTTDGAIVDIAPMEDAWVTVIGTGLACSARDSIYLTVNPSPALEIVAPNAICMGDSVTISASGADSLFWMPNEFISCASCDEITVSPAQSTVFTLSGYNGQCFGTTSLAMEVQEVPVSEVYGDTLVCAYSPADLFVLGGTTYVWSTGDTASAISVEPGETTIYTVVAISGICSDTSFITVEAIPLPQIDAGNDTLITLGGEVQLNATGGIDYVWSPATDLSCTTCSNPLAIPAESITYCVEGIAESGCSDTSCLRIEVSEDCETFFIPNAFAPESGGHEMNDCFRVFGEECFGSMRIRIFDRWGELVYESTEFGDCWDGNYQGKKVNTGVFVYYFDGVLLNGEPFYRKGNVTVIR
jgi:gliding motility-associated-like protein